MRVGLGIEARQHLVHEQIAPKEQQPVCGAAVAHARAEPGSDVHADGIANVGETNPNTIATEARQRARGSIDISTIGVGGNLDTGLLSSLANTNSGLFHLVANEQDVQKVFVNESDSLLAPAARHVTLQIDLPRSLHAIHAIGDENPDDPTLAELSNATIRTVGTTTAGSEAASFQIKVANPPGINEDENIADAIVAAIVAAGVRSVAARSPHLDPAAKLDLLTNVAHAQLVA